MLDRTVYSIRGQVLLFGAITLLAVAGCGPGRGDLRGKVSYKGKTLASGSVVVAGSDGLTKGGEIKSDGAYEVSDIGAGDVRVSVSSPDPGEFKFNPRKKDEKPPPPKDRSKWFVIPEKYGDFEKSGLTFKLSSGANNTFDIELK